MPSDVWALGGPGKFVRAIIEDLTEGRSISIILPSEGVPRGLRSAIRDGLPKLPVNFLDVPSLAPTTRPIVESLSAVLGLDRSSRGRMQVDDFCAHSQLGRRLIWVDCREATVAEAKVWGTFLRHYGAAVSAIPVHTRTVFSTVCTGAQAGLMPDADRLSSKRWWWGILGPLDTELFVFDQIDGDARLPGFLESVTEVAGFDLDVAAMLVDLWDGDADQLRSLLTAYRREVISSGGIPVGIVSPAERPSPELIPAWSAGLINAWGDSNSHLHPCQVCIDSIAGLRHLVWRGQVRSLMPRIEIARQGIATWVLDRRDRLPPDWAGEDIMALEVGGLSTLMNAAPDLVRRDRIVADRAHWLRRARNKIAHLEILDRVELERADQIFGEGAGARVEARAANG